MGQWLFYDEIQGRQLDVAVRCELPALHCAMFIYELEAKEAKGVHYIHGFVAWKRSPFCLGVAYMLCEGSEKRTVEDRVNRGDPESAFDGLLTRNADKTLAPLVVLWQNFAALNRLALLTGRWAMHPPAVLEALDKGDYFALACEHMIRFSPSWLGVHLNHVEAVEVFRFFNFILDQTIEEGPRVPHTTIHEQFMDSAAAEGVVAELVRRNAVVWTKNYLGLTWALELGERFAALHPAAAFYELEPTRLTDGAAVYPEVGAVTVVRDAHCVSVREFLAKPWPPGARVIAVGAFCACTDRFVNSHDLALTGLRNYGTTYPRVMTLQKSEAFARVAKKGRHKGSVLVLPEWNTEERHRQIKDLAGDKPRVVHVFPAGDVFTPQLYDGAPPVNWLCIETTPDCKEGEVATLTFTKKEKPRFTRRDKPVVFKAEAFRPLVICRDCDLPRFEAEDFDVVVFFGQQNSPKRWIREALRVGRQGITVFYGMQSVPALF